MVSRLFDDLRWHLVIQNAEWNQLAVHMFGSIKTLCAGHVFYEFFEFVKKPNRQIVGQSFNRSVFCSVADHVDTEWRCFKQKLGAGFMTLIYFPPRMPKQLFCKTKTLAPSVLTTSNRTSFQTRSIKNPSSLPCMRLNSVAKFVH